MTNKNIPDPKTGLTPKQMKALDDMVARRLANTDETESEARGLIADYFKMVVDDLRRAGK